jgi:hypothetical protein
MYANAISLEYVGPRMLISDVPLWSSTTFRNIPNRMLSEIEAEYICSLMLQKLS